MQNQQIMMFFLLAGCSTASEMPVVDAGSVDGSTVIQTDAGADFGTPVSACLEEKSYAGDIALGSAFPFCVKRRFTAPKSVLGAHWGQHGGPIVSSGKVVIRYTFPAQTTGVSTATEVTFKPADSLPTMFFYGADGMVDLPFGPYALLSYTTSAMNYPGEALLYAKDYDQVVSRARVNGFYSGVGVPNGSTGRVIYTGLSGLTAAATPTAENGLYASDLCGGSLVPTAPCLASRKLLGWTGGSGPVTRDQSGNVFVAAFVSGGAHSDQVYALSKAEALGTVLIPAVALAAADSSGTSCIAAVAPTSDKVGWVLAKGYDFGAVATAYAQGYQSRNDHLEKSGAVVSDAIKPGTASAGFTLFTDNHGALWVASETASEKAFLELQPRP